MAYEYFFIDETDIQKEEKGETKSRKMVFIGSRAEIESWLPETFDPADFTFPVDSIRWAGSDFIIYTAKASAINRFEWDVRLVAKNYRDFSGPTQNPEKNENLLEVTKNSISSANFSVTAKMAGFKLDPATNGYIIDPDYSATDDSPFNQSLDISDINTILKMDVHNFKRYLNGPPEQQDRYRRAFSGVVTHKGFKGRAADQNMDEVLGADSNIYTEWNMKIEMPPTGFSWNTSWRGIV